MHTGRTYPTDTSFLYNESPTNPSEADYPLGLHPDTVTGAPNGSGYGPGHYEQGSSYLYGYGYDNNSLPIGGRGPSPALSGEHPSIS